jgi:hypothetical protein
MYLMFLCFCKHWLVLFQAVYAHWKRWLSVTDYPCT